MIRLPADTPVAPMLPCGYWNSWPPKSVRTKTAITGMFDAQSKLTPL
jgi:hypothetical protein